MLDLQWFMNLKSERRYFNVADKTMIDVCIYIFYLLVRKQFIAQHSVISWSHRKIAKLKVGAVLKSPALHLCNPEIGIIRPRCYLTFELTHWTVAQG